MTDKEISIKSVLFLVTGILLLLSLVICIYLINGERDLVLVSADVVDVKKDTDGTGKNDVTVAYTVNNAFYEYNFYYKDDINVNDKIDVYYHENNVTSVQTFKTSKLIFVCPIVGLILCVIGLFELFKKPKEGFDDEDFQTQVISVVGETQQLEIITDEEKYDYVKTEEEMEETPVKSLNSKERENPFLQLQETDVEEEKKAEELLKDLEIEERPVNKKVVKALPNYYYVSGNTLVFEEPGKGIREFDISEIRRMVKTINSKQELIRLNVITDEIDCILRDMKKTDLNQTANLLHNKIITDNPDFSEEVVYKES